MISIVFEVYKALLQKGTALEFAPSFQGDKMLVPLAKRNFFLGDNLEFLFLQRYDSRLDCLHELSFVWCRFGL